MNIVESFAKVKILVIGDVMLDKYWWGSVTRISPEAPVPIVDLKETSSAVGGAANVAANAAGLGAETFLIGTVGDDSSAVELAELLQKMNISPNFLVKTKTRPTTLKMRVMAQHQQVVRIDQETSENIGESVEDQVWEKVLECLEQIKVVIISDYAKGFLTENILSRLITSCNSKNIIVLVDPKGKDFSKYRNADILTPNRKEAFGALGFGVNENESLENIGKKLMSDLSLKGLLITLGEDGLSLFRDQKETLYLKALARHVYDVTGAGDTVIATFAVALGAGLSWSEAAEVANIAAGFVVEEIGTTTIEINKLSDYLENQKKLK